MWASSAAIEIMKTPRSASTEMSILSRRTLLTAHHPPSGALYVGIGRKRRTGSSSGTCLAQQLGPRVGAVEGLGQRLGRLLLLLGQLLGHLDLEPVADVAVALAPRLRRPLALEPLDRAVPGSRPDLDLLRAVEGWHLDRRPAQRLGDRDRHRNLEVATVEPLEDRRAGDAGDDEEVARRAAALAGLALAGEPDAGAVLHPGGDVHPVTLGLLGEPGAAAGRAGVLDDLAGAATLRTGLGDREEALALGVDAPPFAAWAGDRARPGFGSAAAAGHAPFGLRHGHLDLRSVHRLVEAEADLGFQVAPASLLRLRPPAPAAAEEVGEDVADVEAARATAERTPAAGRAAEAAEHAPARVVLLALLGVREHVVGALNLLEALLRLGVVGVAVGVVSPGELPVRLLDLLVGRPLGDAQNFVEILCHRLLAHHHARRPDQLLVEPVALLHHLDDRPRLDPVRGHRRKRLVHRRVELLPLRIDRLDPISIQGVAKAAKDQQDAV